MRLGCIYHTIALSAKVLFPPPAPIPPRVVQGVRAGSDIRSFAPGFIHCFACHSLREAFVCATGQVEAPCRFRIACVGVRVHGPALSPERPADLLDRRALRHPQNGVSCFLPTDSTCNRALPVLIFLKRHWSSRQLILPRDAEPSGRAVQRPPPPACPRGC